MSVSTIADDGLGMVFTFKQAVVQSIVGTFEESPIILGGTACWIKVNHSGVRYPAIIAVERYDGSLPRGCCSIREFQPIYDEIRTVQR
ncbi:hypothetical protein D3C73_619670 [compost metagenome]